MAWFAAAVRAGTFLADDYLLIEAILTPERAVDWRAIGRQMFEPWLSVSPYYRPLFNLSLALNVALLGPSPTALLAVNLALHAFTVAAIAWLCAILRPGAPSALAACAGGTFAALHPMAGEPVLWISARVTGLQCAFGALALVAFAAHLRTARRSTLALAWLATAGALLTKEAALGLPVGLVVLDLLIAQDRSWRARLLRHGPIGLLVLLYLALRYAVLGTILAAPQLDFEAPELGFGSIFMDKLGVLFAPGETPLGAWPWLVAIALAACALRDPITWRYAAGLGLWLLATLLPSFRVPLASELVGSRLLYDALLPLAALLTAALITTKRPRTGALVALGLAAAQLPVGHAMVDRYHKAWQDMSSLTKGLEAAVPADRPLGLLNAPLANGVPGPMHPMAFGLLLRPPFGSDVGRVVSLGALSHREADLAPLRGDPRPVHMLLDLGGTIAAYDYGVDQVWCLPRQPVSEDEIRTDGDGYAWLPQPASPFDFEAIEITAAATATEGRLDWLLDRQTDAAPGITFAGGEQLGDRRRFVLDASREPLVAAGAMAGVKIRGVKVNLSGVESVRFGRRLPILSLPAPLAGRRVGLDQLQAAIQVPATPPGTRLTMFLIGDSVAHAIAVQDGQPDLPPKLLTHLRQVMTLLHGTRYWLAFAADAPQGHKGHARSLPDPVLLVP